MSNIEYKNNVNIYYFYLDAALRVLSEKSLNMTIARPVLEMLESGLPPPCSTKKFCILGFNPKDHVYDISKYVTNPNQWKYE